jgi:hypothetical protein
MHNTSAAICEISVFLEQLEPSFAIQSGATHDAASTFAWNFLLSSGYSRGGGLVPSLPVAPVNVSPGFLITQTEERLRSGVKNAKVSVNTNSQPSGRADARCLS